MNFFKILQIVSFLLLCFFIYLCLSDVSALYYLPKLGKYTFYFVFLLFFEKIYQAATDRNKLIKPVLFNILIVFLWVLLLICVSRSDILPGNEIYSLGRIVYVFGTVLLTGVFTFIMMKISFVNSKMVFNGD